MTKLSSSNPAGPSTPESRRVGWRNGTAVGLTVAAVAALFMLRKCEPDRLVPPEPPCVAFPNGTTLATSTDKVPKGAECIECAPPLSAPVKGDGKCELDKGEGAHKSKDYDPESCGRCGNDKADPLEVPVVSDPAARQTVIDQIAASGIQFTGVPVPEGCLADTHTCLPGVPGSLAGMPAVSTGIIREVNGPNGTAYELVATVIGCTEANPLPAARRVTPECTDDVVARVHGILVDAVHQNARAIRSKLGATGVAVTVSIDADVNRSGKIVPSGGSVTCNDCTKPDAASAVLADLHASLARQKAADAACTIGPALKARLPIERNGQ